MPEVHGCSENACWNIIGNNIAWKHVVEVGKCQKPIYNNSGSCYLSSVN